MLQALIFDVDGTLADTEGAHRAAFNAAFAQVGLDWHWSEALYTRLLEVAGGKERIAHYWQSVDPVAARSLHALALAARIHAIKTLLYAEQVEGGKLALRPGVRRLIHEAHAAGMPMAIATTTTPANVEALLRTPFGADWRKYFVVVCDGASTALKKPAPDVYHAALRGLGLPAYACIAFEDTENGLRAATAAGIPTIITPTAYTALHSFADALLVLPHLGDPGHPLGQRIAGAEQRWVDLAALARWHEGTLFEAS
jgi:HAD superfamily hydrolase (TIGR01509 family)